MKHYFTRLQDMMAAHWDKPALCNYKGESFTFGELATKIARFHLVFEAVGIKKGDRIALCARNSARWGVSFLAINTYEAVVVPILSDFLPESVNALVAHSESKVLFTDTDLWKKLDIEKMPMV
ncbi:MAG: AMP-binding protein, partial [Bacteroidales bacterium]|nr:AMP-binding protein [Bacteroidales bacterium]